MASPLLTSLSSFHSASLPNTSSMRSEFQKSGGYKPQGPTKFVGPSLLVLKTADSNIFGAYLSEYIRPCINHYGSADW